MNTKRLFKNGLMIALLAHGAMMMSCSSDNSGAVDEMMDESDEVSLNFTLDGTAFEASFGTNSIFLALSDGASTILSTSGALTTGQTYVFAASFVGTGTGTYTLNQGAGETDEDISGLSVAILNGQTDINSYFATNVTLTITSYEVVSAAQIILKGTFSGTLENEETSESATITNGSFVTGFNQ